MPGPSVQRALLVAGLLGATSGCGGKGGGVGLATGDPDAGKTVFESQGCVHCHTFAAAGSIRNAGPNLDEAARRYPAEFQELADLVAFIENRAKPKQHAPE